MGPGFQKSYDLHAEMAKQIITLSTALIALVVAGLTAETPAFQLSWHVYSGLAALILAIISGILHLGALAKSAESDTKPTGAEAVLWTARIQQLLFVGAIILFGVKALF